MSTRLALACILVVACGDDGGGGTPDAAITAPPMITITGTATSRGTSSMALSGVTIEAYRNGADGTVVATTTTGANGAYSLVIATGGVALDGYIKAKFAGYIDTYLYPPTIVTTDLDSASVNMITSNTRDLLANTVCNANQPTTNGMIAVVVIDGTETPVAGATVSSSPPASKYCYNQGGFPNRNATMTDTDGIAYMFNVTGGATLGAMKDGQPFQSHDVNARAGAFTTTLIQP